MKSNILLDTTMILCFLTKAQNLSDEIIMGEWKAVSVEIPNSSKIPEKQALKFIEDAFLGSQFKFKGNKVFNIKFGNTADKRIEELFSFDNKNWTIKDNQILIGKENNGFSSINITFQKVDDKTFFLLPMIRLEMKKLSDDKASKPKIIETISNKNKNFDDSKDQFVREEIDKSEIIDFKEAENPPLAPKCKAKWNVEKRRECTRKYITMHINKKYDIGLAPDSGLKGKTKITAEFVIDKNGKIINIVAYGGPEIMNQQAVKVINQLPEFKPGIKQGKPVNIAYKTSITFIIHE